MYTGFVGPWSWEEGGGHALLSLDHLVLLSELVDSKLQGALVVCTDVP